MAERYSITPKQGYGSRSFYVHKGTRPVFGTPVVWVGDDNVPRCTNCSGPLRAMLTSCPHARAVKRFLKAQRGER